MVSRTKTVVEGADLAMVPAVVEDDDDESIETIISMF